MSEQGPHPLGGEQSPDAHDLEVEALRKERDEARKERDNALAALADSVVATGQWKAAAEDAESRLAHKSAWVEKLRGQLARARTGKATARNRAATWQALAEKTADCLARFVVAHGKSGGAEKKGLAALLGQWPGDEPVEVLEAQVRALKAVARERGCLSERMVDEDDE